MTPTPIAKSDQPSARSTIMPTASRVTRHFAILFLALAPALAGCSHKSTQISIINQSGGSLSNIWVSGEHFAQSAGSMTPNQTLLRFSIPSKGDTNAWLNFEVNGKKINASGRDCFNLGSADSVSLTIASDLKVTSSSGMKHY